MSQRSSHSIAPERETQSSLLTADLDYHLPPELIAQAPLADRAGSRLLVLDRSSAELAHSCVRELPRFLRAGDLLVANNSRVLPARLRATKIATGGRVELLLLRRLECEQWLTLAKPSRRLSGGTVLHLSSTDGSMTAELEVVDVREGGEVIVRLPESVAGSLERWGEVPLPPYVRRQLDDAERYQTVYARTPGSAAAPTAGLHITRELIGNLAACGVGWAEVTLHIGLDTFRPVLVDRLADHKIHSEWCSVDDEVARAIAATRAAGGRVVAVGTTAARTLETLGRHWDQGEPRGWSGATDIYILPGHRWQLVDALLTNFHLPRTTLLAMVSALAGWDRISAAYREAIEQRYRFYSFGDAMLIL